MIEAGSTASITDEQGEPWFVAKDVCEALGYSNTRDAIAKHVDDEDRNTVAIRDGNVLQRKESPLKHLFAMK